MRTFFFSLLASFGLIIISTNLSQADDMRFFKIASGGAGGTYYPIATLIAKVISNPPGSKSCDEGGNCGIEGLSASARSSGGSVANVDAMLKGEYASSIAQSDVAYWSYSGTGPFRKRKPNKAICSLASLYPEDMHLVVANGSGITGIADLKTKTVAMGKRSSGALLGAQLLVRAYGLQEGKDFKTAFVNLQEARDLMTNGKLDAFLFVTGHPNQAITGMLKKGQATLAPITGKGREILAEKSPFYSLSAIPQTAYPGQTGDIDTVAVSALWLGATKLDQNFVYRLIKTFWENKHARSILARGHPKGQAITLSSAFDGVSIPLCAGAEKYYREIGRLK